MTDDESASWPDKLAWVIAVPAVTALGLRHLIPHRTDYLGHFLAGYGASLFLVWLSARVTSGRPAPVAASAFVAIGLGYLAEATLFPLGGFDLVDLYTQSFGAVLAGLAMVILRAGDPLADWDDGASPLTRNGLGRLVTVAGGLSLVLGVVYATT